MKVPRVRNQVSYVIGYIPKKVINKICINNTHILIIYTFKVEWDQTAETIKIRSQQEKWVKWDGEFLPSLLL